MAAPPQIGVSASGLIFGCPAQVAIESDPRGYRIQGSLQLEGKAIADLLAEVDHDLLVPGQGDPIVAAVVSEILDHLPPDLELEVAASAERTSIALAIARARVQIVRRGSTGTAVVMRLADEATFTSAVAQRFLEAVRNARGQLGLTDLVLAYRRGTGITLSDLTGDPAAAPIPSSVQTANAQWIVHASLGPATTSGTALRSLFGGSQLDVYIALRHESNDWTLVGALAIRVIQTRILTAEDLQLAIRFGGGPPTFRFRGTITVPGLGDARMTVSGDFGVGSFVLAGDMEIGSQAAFSSVPGSRFESFSLEDVGILIGYDKGLTFGVQASFTLLDQAIFGAAILTLEGDIPVPRLVSGAIEPIFLPRLFRNVTRSDIEGLDAFDILSIDRLDLDGGNFPLQPGPDDVHQVVDHFNAQVQGVSPLAADSTRIRRRRGGYGLVDQLHMRHYFVDGATGALSLEPQFYVSEMFTQFASYSVEPGIFLAGKITVLKPSVPGFSVRGSSFKVLFSLSETSGILAYASLDPIEIKLGSFTAMRISASDQAIPSRIRLPEHDLAAQLVPAHPQGPVFFLSASKRDVTFSFDGHLELVGLFKFDARVIYFSRNVSIHAVLDWLGIQVVFLLDAEYAKFCSARFAFRLQIDTRALTDALGAVTSEIDKALQSLHATIDSALAALAAAQQRVDQLRHEIDDLDARIASCQRAIDAASWWKKVFVAVAKGAEIAAYEVAKAGVWTAIGAATEALEVARLAVETFDKIDAALLELVNAAIRDASRLLFLRSAELSATVSLAGQEFSVALSFTALGKTHDVSRRVTLDVVRDGFLAFLSEQVRGELTQDLHAISAGKLLLREGPGKPPSEASPDGAPRIQGAAAEIDRATAILGRLQTRYRDTFGEDPAELARLDAEFSVALHASHNALATASQVVGARAFAKLRDGVRRHATTLSAVKRSTQLETALKALDRRLQQSVHVDHALDAVTKARTDTALLGATRGATKHPVEDAAPEDAMIGFLQQIEDDLTRAYKTSDPTYINLLQEKQLDEYFRDAFDHLNARREPVRRKAAIPTYRPRFRAAT